MTSWWLFNELSNIQKQQQPCDCGFWRTATILTSSSGSISMPSCPSSDSIFFVWIFFAVLGSRGFSTFRFSLDSNICSLRRSRILQNTHTHTIRTTTWDLNNLCPYAQNTKPPTALGQKQRRNTLSNHAALLIRHFLKKFPRMPLLMLALMTLQCIRDIAEF